MKARHVTLILALIALFFLSNCATKSKTIPRAAGWKQKGNASWYGKELNGNPTASGETFNMYDLTAAHRTLPFQTKVRVTNRNNGKSVVVRINDRGPFQSGRIIDLSYKAAQKIDMIQAGVVPVIIEVVKAP